jgi:hypothetical protein
MLDEQTGPILCGKCHVTPERGFERDGQIWARCSTCGQEDTVADIQREAMEYLVHKSVRDALSGFSGGAITVKGPPEREYRWITG